MCGSGDMQKQTETDRATDWSQYSDHILPCRGRNNKPATSPYTMSYVASARGITAENMEKSRRYD